MTITKYDLIHTALQMAHKSGIPWLLSPVLGGIGAIVTLHHVRPLVAHEFAPNRILEITPDFLGELILALKFEGYHFVSMDEMAHAIEAGNSTRNGRLIAFTLDDGYRDNVQHALPIFETFKVPFCQYIPTAFPAGDGVLWWLALEEIIRNCEQFTFSTHGKPVTLPCTTLAEKHTAWDAVYMDLKTLNEAQLAQMLAEIFQTYGFDARAHCQKFILSWPELQQLAHHPLCTLGAHTVHHVALKRCGDAQALEEMVASAGMLEHHTGKRPVHFAYPYGGALDVDARSYNLARQAGFTTAVTTNPGVITPAHAKRMMHLPRISVNGLFQNVMEMSTLISGFPVRLLNN